jgi:chromosome partitioning protein
MKGIIIRGFELLETLFWIGALCVSLPGNRRLRWYAVLLTRTHPSIRARGLAHIQNGLIEAGIPVLQTELNERDAFKAVFSFRQTLDGLNAAEVPNLDKAKLNVLRFVEEVFERLKAEEGGRKENQQSSTVAGAA